jgi:glyoxylase I family protein
MAVALTVTDLAASAPWCERLLGSGPVLDEELGIPHGGIVDAHYGSGLAFRDPDNIALELFAPPG